MDWLKALNTFFKVKGIYDKGKQVEKLYKYGKKLDPKKVTWDDLKFFQNKQMTEATKAGREAEAALDKALATPVVWPESGASSILIAAFKSADKNGLQSPRTQKAVLSYYMALLSYEDQLTSILKELEARQKEMPGKIKTAQALQEYGRVLHDAFMMCAKVPNPTGTAANATYFSLAQDAQQFAGVAGSVQSRLVKLEAKNAKAIAEGKALIKTNKAWILWASGKAKTEDGSIKKNLKGAKPK